MEDAENKTYENEVDRSSEPKTSNYGGKREGAGRPMGSKTKKKLEIYGRDGS